MRTICFLALTTASLYASPARLTCDYLVDPLGIGSAKPRFSWQSNNKERNFHQSGYRILVASSPELLSNGKSDVWESGRRQSDDSVSIEYGGPALKSATLWGSRLAPPASRRS